MTEKKGTFTDEVNNRLGEFFGGMEKSQSPTREADGSAPEGSELYDLKVIILSIEWEISDEIMTRLIGETDRLMKIFRDNKIVLSLLKLLDSVGKYIKAKKATAHPDAIKLLHSVHTNLQRVATSENLTDAQCSQILSAEIVKFKNLKQQLLTKAEPVSLKEKKPAAITAPQKTAAPVERKQPATPPKEASATPPADTQADKLQDPVLQAIDELKNLIQEEFKKLREELKRLRQ